MKRVKDGAFSEVGKREAQKYIREWQSKSKSITDLVNKLTKKNVSLGARAGDAGNLAQDLDRTDRWLGRFD